MAATSFDNAFPALIQAAGRQRGLQPSSDLIAAIRACGPLSDEAAATVARALGEVGSPSGAGVLAVWLGAGVEADLDPKLTCRPIIDAFLKWSRTIETAPVREDAGEEDDSAARQDDPEPDAETLDGLQLLGQALVAHLSRSPEDLRQMAETPEIFAEIERIEHLSIGAVWILHLLRQQSGELVVLDIAHRRGALVRYNNIANCFHLFTLLQGALSELFPGAGELSEEVLAIARGESQGEGHDQAWWHYGQPTVPQADIDASIWGEGTPDQIARIDGKQVLLLWPRIMESRSWDASFFMPVLHASLPSVELASLLSAAEVERWWARLDLPASWQPAAS